MLRALQVKRTCFLVSLCLVAAQPSAFAQAPVRRPAGPSSTGASNHSGSLAESLKGPAAEAFQSAQILKNNGDDAGALLKYEEAYGLSKDPRLLFNMAVCARSLKAYARMQELLRSYLREAAASLSAQEEMDVDNALAAIRNLVGSVQVDVNEAGAAVSVDGRSVGTTPLAPLTLDLGSHVVSVRKSGFAPVDQALQVAGGRDAAVAIELTRRRVLVRLQHGVQCVRRRLRQRADRQRQLRRLRRRIGVQGRQDVRCRRVRMPGRDARLQRYLREQPGDGDLREDVMLGVRAAHQRNGPMRRDELRRELQSRLFAVRQRVRQRADRREQLRWMRSDVQRPVLRRGMRGQRGWIGDG